MCFNAPADAPIPSTPEAVRQEALQLVAGWEWGVEDAIQRTAPEELTRSRIVDRWGTALPTRRWLHPPFPLCHSPRADQSLLAEEALLG